MKPIGIVTSRVCPQCGHHEVGFTTREGEYHPLRPGMLIQVLEEEKTLPSHGGEGDAIGDLTSSDASPGPSEAAPRILSERSYEPPDQPGEEGGSETHVWVPAPVRGDPLLRLKYGVRIGEDPRGGDISPEAYQKAYVNKLRQLIEREVHIPWAVILDRFFAAPHLAEGEPKQIAKAMWEELDEVKEPVWRVRDWLLRQDSESLAKMIHPRSKEDLEDRPADNDALKGELNGLSLEEFLEML